MADKISITICGDGGCGKSSITLRLVRSQWTHEYDPTIEDSYSVTRTIDGLPYFLSLTDTAGQEEYRGLWAASNLQSDAFLLVYDITNPSSLDALSYFMDMIDVESEQRAEDNVRAAKQRLKNPGGGTRLGEKEIKTKAMPVKIVAGNKCDLKDARAVTSRQGLEWARRHGCGFMETSAREMVNIEETFALIVRRVVEARKQIAQNPTPHLHQHRQSKTSGSGSHGKANGHAHSNSYSATKPLPPPEESGTEKDNARRGARGRDREKAAMAQGQGQRDDSRGVGRKRKRRPANEGFWSTLFGFCRR